MSLAAYPSHLSAGRTLGYELRRLRLPGLIERVPKTHRYRLTDLGLRTAMFYTPLLSRVLRPGLAVVSRATVPVANSPLQCPFRAAGNAIHLRCDEAQIAA